MSLLVDLMMFIPTDLSRNLVVCLLNQDFFFFTFTISNVFSFLFHKTTAKIMETVAYALEFKFTSVMLW